MAVEIGHASTDGVPNAEQVKVANWYLDKNGGWMAVIRPKNDIAAQQMADLARAACNHDNVLYSMGSKRESFYHEMVKANYDVSKLPVCYADCSSFANAIAIIANKLPYIDSDSATIVANLGDTGKFDVYRDAKYLNSSDYLRTGDILVKERVEGVHGGHVVVILTNGPLAPPLNGGIALIDASGEFDESTIKSIQKLFNFEETGKIIKQPPTYQNYLPKHLFPTCEITIGNVAGGDPLVKEFQKMLGITADGYFGRMTINALQRFLVMQGYPIGLMDGKVSPIVIQSFQKYINTLIEKKNAELSAAYAATLAESQRDMI